MSLLAAVGIQPSKGFSAAEAEPTALDWRILRRILTHTRPYAAKRNTIFALTVARAIQKPALAWAIWIEVSGRICPLTPLEVSLRREAGESGYTGGFLDHYVGGILYPAGLTRQAQWTAAGLLIAVNLVVYGLLMLRAARRRRV